nr:hypothetical protein Iba_chr06dCG0650 [Ipomoea batatas]GMD09846.1 hypothetical protein Iba_chr06eCG0540 [Ipomoea batatas]GMD11054.1 hypothetical protein Iba_chr06fCG0680 [Ipomoea batatas]
MIMTIATFILPRKDLFWRELLLLRVFRQVICLSARRCMRKR